MHMKSFVSQLINRSSILNNVPSIPGSCFVVNPMLRRLARSLTLRHRALDTIHEALTVSGGLFPRPGLHPHLAHIVPHIVYKYVMAGLVNPSSMLIGNP